MKKKTVFKLFSAFLGASKLRAASTAFISSAILILLIIMQSFLTFDGNRAVEGIAKSDSSVVSLRKSVYTSPEGEEVTSKLHYITDENLEELSDLGGSKMKSYLLYSYCLPIDITESKETVEAETIHTPTYGRKNIYVSSMGGTLACDEEYLDRKSVV